jgi:hypothetical protein
VRTLSPGSPSSPTASQPDPKKGPQIANPARLPGHQHARHRESWHTKIIYGSRDQLTALFADSGQMLAQRTAYATCNREGS